MRDISPGVMSPPHPIEPETSTVKMNVVEGRCQVFGSTVEDSPTWA
jgi:hypothetical protein